MELRSGRGKGGGGQGGLYLRDGSLATVRATIFRASGWPAEEEANDVKRERQIFHRQKTWKKGALK
jgi:hypothetical protein